MQTSQRSTIFAHRGEWFDNDSYNSGQTEFIPIRKYGMNYKNLLTKIDMHLKKPKDGYLYDIDALVMSPQVTKALNEDYR